MAKPRMSRSERREDRKRRGEQLLTDLQADPDAHGAFTVQFALRLLVIYTGQAAALIAVIIAIIHAIAQRRRGARYILTSRPTVAAAALGTGGYLAGLAFHRWTGARADQIHGRARTEPEEDPQQVPGEGEQ